MADGSNLVGIFGPGRNGSTLLMRLIDGCRGLWVHPVELNYYHAFPDGKSGCRWPDFVRKNLEETYAAYARGLESPIRRPDLNVPGDNGLGIGEDLPQLLSLSRKMYDQRGCDEEALLCFKSIQVSHVSEYERVFPNMRFVHIIRNPVTNYESLKRTDIVRKSKPFWYQGGDCLRMHIEDRWLEHARILVHRLKERPDKHTLVRYEDLCSSPSKEIWRICEWLNVSPPEDIDSLTVLGGCRMRDLPSNSSQRGVKTPQKVAGAMDKKFSYDEVLTSREVDFIWYRLAPLAARFGYAPGNDRIVSRWQLAQAWLPVDQWEQANATLSWKLIRAIVRRRAYIYSKLLRDARE